jgi:hypothetical protein
MLKIASSDSSEGFVRDTPAVLVDKIIVYFYVIEKSTSHF